MVAISDEALINLLERTPKGELPRKGDPKVKVTVGGATEEFYWHSWIYTQTSMGRGRGYSESLARALKKHDYVPEEHLGCQRLRNVSSVDEGQGQTGNSRGQEESLGQSEPAARVNPEFGYHVGTGAQGHITTPYTAYGESSVSPVESVFTAYEQSNISTGMFPSAAYNPSGHSPDSDFMDWFREVSNPMELFYPPDFGNQEAQNVPASPVYGYGYQEVQNVPAHPVYGYGNQVGGLGPYVSPSQAPTAMDYGRPAEGYDRNSLPDNRFAEHVRGTQPPLGRTGQAAAAGRGMTADDRRALAREVLPQLQADLREMRNGKGKTPRR